MLLTLITSRSIVLLAARTSILCAPLRSAGVVVVVLFDVDAGKGAGDSDASRDGPEGAADPFAVVAAAFLRAMECAGYDGVRRGAELDVTNVVRGNVCGWTRVN